MALIRLQNITKIFKKDTPAQVIALNNINIEIQKGECIAIVGRSGSGKSTLLHILGFLDKMSDGKYFLEDTDIDFADDKTLAEIRNKKIGFIIQDFGLLLNKTSYDNIAIPLYFNNNIKSKQIPGMVCKVIEDVGITDKTNQLVAELSGGQKQRVAIARALVNNPDIILADEPTGSLDSKTGEDIINLLLQLNQKGKTVLIVTHDMNIAKMCGRIIRIDDGQIVPFNT